MDLEALLRAARDREPGAWDALAPRLSLELRGFFVREFGDLDPVELTQRTMVILARELPGFVPRKTLKKWAFGIARNQGRREHRTRAKHDRIRELVAPVADAPVTSPSAQAYRNEVNAVVREEIDQLPPKYRLVVESYLAGERIESYAHKQDLKPSTARTHRFRAFAILRKRLVMRLHATLVAPAHDSTPSPP